MSRHKGCIAVSDILRRPDKSVANDSGAMISILSSTSTVLVSADADRRVALMWCNTLRRHLFAEAIRRDENKLIVINIGAGGGQSVDDLDSKGVVSIVHIEPDPGRCEALSRRLGIKSVIKDPRDIIPQIRPLKTRSVLHVVVCCKVEDVLADEEICSALFPEVRCVMATFSAQLCIPALEHLQDSWALPVYGCLYTYDDTAVGQCLVDCYDTQMKRTTTRTCTVSWGGDRSYTEPYVTSAHLYRFRLRPAYDVIGRVNILQGHPTRTSYKGILLMVYAVK